MRNFIFLLLLCGWQVSASEARLTILTEQWLPYNYLNDQGEIVGNATRTVKSRLQEAGIPYRIQMMNWARSYHMARQLPNHAVYSTYRTTEREPYFHWFCPLTEHEPIYVFRLTDNRDIKVESEADLTHYTIAVNRSDWTHDYLLALGLKEGEQMDVSADQDVVMTKFLAGRVQLAMNTLPAMAEVLKAKGLAVEAAEPVWLLSSAATLPVCLALNKHSDPELVQKLRRSFELAAVTK